MSERTPESPLSQSESLAAGEAAPGTGFNEIVAICALDDSDADTLQMAARIAGASGGRVTLLAVVEPPHELSRIAKATGMSGEQICKKLAGQQRERLQQLAVRSRLDPAPAVAIRIGKAFIEIIRHVIENGCDLVVKAGEAVPGLSRYLFASTDQHLLRKCPCPVWLLRGPAPRPIANIVAAIDADTTMASEPETMAGLNRLILATAARIAAIDGAQIHVLHAWDAPGEGLVQLWSGAPDREEAVRKYVEDLQTVHWRELDRIVAEARRQVAPQVADRVRFQATAERGAARSVIPEQVRTLLADILVMGTVARTNVPGFIIGNTAEDVLNSVECPVVTVKPPHYVSPVKGLV